MVKVRMPCEEGIGTVWDLLQVLNLSWVQDFKDLLLQNKSVEGLVARLLQGSKVVNIVVEEALVSIVLLPFGIMEAKPDLEGVLILNLVICTSIEKMLVIGVVDFPSKVMGS